MEIGFLVFPHITQLDLTGPQQVLAHPDAPKLDLLCVPGGPGADVLLKGVRRDKQQDTCCNDRLQIFSNACPVSRDGCGMANSAARPICAGQPQPYAQMLPEARRIRLPYVETVTDVDNVASQRVILANGGVLVEQFEKLPAHGGGAALRFRIIL